MKVLLVNPKNNYEAGQNEAWSKFPLGLLYVAAGMLDKEVRILDLNIDEDTLEAVLNSFKPDQIGVTCWMDNFVSVQQIVEICKSVRPQATLVAGGPFASVTPQTYTEMGFDRVHEGAYCFPSTHELIAAYKRHFPSERMEKYLDGGNTYSNHRVAMVATSFSCPHKCGFCSPSYLGCKYTERDLGEVGVEIVFLKEEYGVNALYIIDASVCTRRRRTLAVCEVLKRQSVAWYAEARVDELDPELVNTMAHSGCVELLVGIEGFDQEVLESSGKRTTLDQNYKAIRMVEAAGIDLVAFVILGLPGQTKEQLNLLIKEVARLKIAVIPNMLFPIPGTPIWEEAVRQDKAPDVVELARTISLGYDKSDRALPVVNLTNVSDETLVEAMRAIFRLNKKVVQAT